MKNIYYLVSGILIITSSNIAQANTTATPYKHNIGYSYGKGKPYSLSGYRLNYRYNCAHYSLLAFSLDASYASWKVKYPSYKKLKVFALAPIIRLNLFPIYSDNVFLEGSVGIAHRSNAQLANKKSGSKWTFQDILGIGFTLLDKKLDLRLQYMHYSNAKLAKPNPGTEIIPMLTASYSF